MAFKMRSGYKPPFKQMGSSPMKQGLRDIRESQANLTENPSADYSGEVLGEGGWSQTPTTGADVEHLRRTNFEYAEGTKKGDAERAAHEDYLTRRSKKTMRMDLKKGRATGESQLTARQVKMGMSQVQDPSGAWHTISKKGKLVGSSSGYTADQKAWRQKYSPAGPIEGDRAITTKPSPQIEKLPTKTTEKIIPKKDSGPTFDEAFASARKSGKKEFDWAGKKTGGETRSFNTMLKGESKTDWLKNIGKGKGGGGNGIGEKLKDVVTK